MPNESGHPDLEELVEMSDLEVLDYCSGTLADAVTRPGSDDELALLNYVLGPL